MDLNLSADDVLTTTRSVRKRLDFDKPVDRSLILECIDIAQQAPTGSNRQGWQWMVIGDEAKKKAVSELYAKNFNWYASQPGQEYAAGDTRAERSDKVRTSAEYLAENFHRAPYLVIPMIEGRLGEGLPTFAQASVWGSILPAVWSFMMALRARGLGSAWTTLHLPDEEKTAEILGIPFDTYTQAGLFPVAYTIGTDFKLAPRLPAAELTHWDTFGNKG
ncbi:MAG: nitroreductase family protein [Actinomycetota bacterium]